MRTTRGALALAIGAVIAILVGTAVFLGVQLAGDDSGSPGTPHPTSSPTAGAAPADPAVDEAAESALRTIYTWQPRTDKSPGEALVRARPMLAGDLADAAAGEVGDDPIRPRQWDTWAADGDVIRAAAEVVSRNETSADGATRTVKVKQTILHATGDITPLDPVVVAATLGRTNSDEWKLTQMRVQPTQRLGD